MTNERDARWTRSCVKMFAANVLILRKRHHRPRRARAGPQAARHVHRRRRQRRPSSSRVGDSGQRRRRGDERLRLGDRRDAPRGRLLDHGDRRWPRHPRGQAPEDEPERARGDLHGAPRRREVRGHQLQDGRRPARRRRIGRQRALARPGRQRSSATAPQWEMRFKQGKPTGPPEEAGRGARHRHDRLLSPGPDDLPEGRVRRRRSSASGSKSSATCTRA